MTSSTTLHTWMTRPQARAGREIGHLD